MKPVSMAAKPTQEVWEHSVSERLGCGPFLVEAMFNEEVTHSGWGDQ